MLRRLRVIVWAVTAVVLVCWSTSVAWGSVQCEENWEPIQRPEHEGCAAGWVYPGAITYTGCPDCTSGTLYRHHTGTWYKSDALDTDCHRLTNCTYSDADEDSFTRTWRMEMRDGENWVDKGPPGGACDCNNATWLTEPFQPQEGCILYREYRAVCVVDDSPGDGPGGDDALAAAISSEEFLYPPGITDFHVAGGYPQCGAEDGCMTLRYDWTADCCNNTWHLDKVRFREKVTYEANWTTGGGHDLSHNNANCFSSTPKVADPTRQGRSGVEGSTPDYHEMQPADKPYKNSYCEAAQLYQWATGWPDVPDESDDGECWITLQSNTIQRYVEQDGGGWRYRIKKGALECTHALPPP